MESPNYAPRALLCGEDDYNGKNFDHRKPWLLERMKLLEEVFAIRIAAYAVTGNHTTMWCCIWISSRAAWDRDEVIRRWTRLFSGDPLARAYLRGGLDGAALLACMVYVDLNPVRARLCGTLADSDFTSVQARLQMLAEEARRDGAGGETGEPVLPASALGLDAVQWRVLTLEIQKRAIVLFHGLESVKAWERRRMKKAA